MSSARICFGATLVLALSLTASEALAEGISVARFGGEHGHPTTTNATAVYYNPAGIADSTGTHLFADLTAAWRQLSYTHSMVATDSPEPADALGANTGRATLSNIILLPMLGVTHSFGDFALGLGFYTPFGGQASWNGNDNFANNKTYPGPVDGVQRWALINGQIRSSYLTLAAAYRVPHSGLSVGLSGNLIQSLINVTRARTASGDNALNSEGRAWLDVSGWQWSFGVGALYEAIPHRLWFGASYQARPNISGGMTLSGTLHTNFAGVPTSTAVDVHQDMPDVIQLGTRYRPVRDIELRLFGEYTRWSAFKNQCISAKGAPCDIQANGSAAPGETGILLNIPHDWHDTFGVRGGASIWLNPKFEFFSGLGYQSNAVPNSTLDATLPDWNSVSFALGAGYQILPQLHGELSYTQFFSPERNNSGQSELATLQFPSKSPDTGGYYTQNLGVVDVNLDFAF